MKTGTLLIGLSIALAPATAHAQKGEEPPPWAYPVNPPGLKAPADDGAARRVPGSTLTYTLAQVSNPYSAPVWHPGDHPPLPDIVGRGRKPVWACGYCHRADGSGGPENANITGLSIPYITQQLADFKSGARRSAVQKRGPTINKAILAVAITDAELQSAAAYFASIKPRSNVRIVESASVPKTYITGWHLAAVHGSDKEPIGERIIEVPEDLEQFVSRDARARFTAYVPPGSIKRGEALATTGGNGQTVQCGICHGATLKGLGPIPGFAGRSPSYIVRQLYDFKHGMRAGSASALMKPAVAKLTVSDMVALASYAASLEP
jgi:cytochrome c553